MEPFVVSLPANVAVADLDRAFAVEQVASEDSNSFTIKSRETLLAAPAGGPYVVSLYRHVTDRYHRRPCVTLAPEQDGRALTVSWADTTERQFWIMAMAAAGIFAVFALWFVLSVSLLGLLFVLPAVMMVVIAQKYYRSSSVAQRQDCDDAVGVALRAADSAR